MIMCSWSQAVDRRVSAELGLDMSLLSLSRPQVEFLNMYTHRYLLYQYTVKVPSRSFFEIVTLNWSLTGSLKDILTVCWVRSCRISGEDSLCYCLFPLIISVLMNCGLWKP